MVRKTHTYVFSDKVRNIDQDKEGAILQHSA